MSEKLPSIETLEKQLRMLRKKLNRSEQHRADLEDQHDRDQHLYRQLQADLEAARREAEIEAALERVRARTMAMHSSDELAVVVAQVFGELTRLDFELTRCIIWIFDPDTRAARTWMANAERPDEPQRYLLPYHDHPSYQAILAAWSARDPEWVYDLHGDLKTSWDDILFSETEFARLPAEVQAGMRAPDRVVLTACFNSFGALQTAGLAALSDENRAILRRFGRVFEQTYTRFLDLKKAEAQAREAQIEAALERVRSRTMAMHKSDELADAAAVLFQQLEALAMLPPQSRTYIGLMDTEGETVEAWMTQPDGTVRPRSHRTPLTEHASLQAFRDAWKRGEPLLVRDHTGAALDDYLRYVLTLPHTPEDAGYQRLAASPPERLVMTDAFFSDGTLGVMSTALLKPEAQEGLQRFARVFEQTYTRFLDLKKAEAQAREAQIEAALERVRARAMAMHRSDELREVVSKVFEEFQRLDFGAPACCIGIFDEATRSSEWWVASTSDTIMPRSYRIPYLEGWPKDWYQTVYDNWQHGVPFFACSFEGEDKRALDHKLLSETEFGLTSDAHTEDMVPLESLILSYATLTYGVLEVGTTEPIPEDQVPVLQRFAKVIDLTYTRFDDLQQAEARARDATRQASLDRVRAEIASMRNADDLQRITPLVWRELTTLGVPFFRCGVFIIDDDAHTTHTFLSTPDGTSLAALHLPFDSTPLVQQTVAHWRRGQVYTDLWDRDQFVAWVAALVEQGHLDAAQAYQGGDEPPASLALHFLPFTQGMLYVGSSARLSDDQIALVQALADAFSVAYARYEDFRALEAKNAEVERAMGELRATQTQLIHSEKMASLGQLTAGIAHEIKNPLNFVNNFADLSVELTQELKDDLHANPDLRVADIADVLDDLMMMAGSVAKHGRRADAIVKSMMQHAREGTGEREPTAINALVEEYVNLAYHGMRASTPDFTVEIERAYDETVGQAAVQGQELGRVLLNLLSNAFYAVHEKADRETAYAPTVQVSTRRHGDTVEIRIADNGPGIPHDVRDRIFEPFFTTKPTGSGTGLGLSLSYDIVTQGHGGTLAVESEDDEGATFVVTLPATNQGHDPRD